MTILEGTIGQKKSVIKKVEDRYFVGNESIYMDSAGEISEENVLSIKAESFDIGWIYRRHKL